MSVENKTDKKQVSFEILFPVSLTILLKIIEQGVLPDNGYSLLAHYSVVTAKELIDKSKGYGSYTSELLSEKDREIVKIYGSEALSKNQFVFRKDSSMPKPLGHEAHLNQSRQEPCNSKGCLLSSLLNKMSNHQCPGTVAANHAKEKQ